MYANDCIAMRDRDRRRDLKHIQHYSDQELNDAVEAARRKFGDDFFLLLHGVDAYMERRRRRGERWRDAQFARIADDFLWWN